MEEFLPEFKSDLKKQCLVLMGLPASGKSTFINTKLGKIFPVFNRYKVINSDNQVKRMQYQTAANHFQWLTKNVKSETEIFKFKADSSFASRRGGSKVMDITHEWWKANKDKGVKTFFKTFYKPFYATYFDIRGMAKAIDKQLWKTKVIDAGDILIIDTVAAHPKKILKRLRDSHKNNYNNTIIYLEIDAELCIERDKFREEHEGRGVGDEVILNYAKEMDGAFLAYQAEGAKKNGVVDRLIHYRWTPEGDSPIAGSWKQVADYRFALKRKLKNK